MKHLTRAEHYAQAMHHHTQAEQATEKFEELKASRENLMPHSAGMYPQYTQQMAELTSSAYSSWARATFHATMAANPDLLGLSGKATADD